MKLPLPCSKSRRGHCFRSVGAVDVTSPAMVLPDMIIASLH